MFTAQIVILTILSIAGFVSLYMCCDKNDIKSVLGAMGVTLVMTLLIFLLVVTTQESNKQRQQVQYEPVTETLYRKK